MQGIQQHQHLAALVSAALPKDDSDDDPSPRLAAIHSLHPHNSLLLSHSATFLVQAFSQLLSDKCYEVRQAAVSASNGRQNHLMLVDRFIGWALPSLNTAVAVDGTKELALEGLREFLNVGGTDRYALPILKACQVLLEDESVRMMVMVKVKRTVSECI